MYEMQPLESIIINRVFWGPTFLSPVKGAQVPFKQLAFESVWRGQ